MQFYKQLSSINHEKLQIEFLAIKKRIVRLVQDTISSIQGIIINSRQYTKIALNQGKMKNNMDCNNIAVGVKLNESKLQYLEQNIKILFNIEYLSLTAKNQNFSISKTTEQHTFKQSISRSQELFNNYIIDTKPNTQFIQYYQISTKKSNVCKIKHTIPPYAKSLQVLDKCYIIGGSVINSNQKVGKILEIDLFNKFESSVFGSLIQARSSHALIFCSPFIFVVGGNKNNQIITKSCEKINIYTKSTESISNLNYCVSAATLIRFSDNFIYKFGGIGEKFDTSGLSPYIQRYSMKQDEWEIINPVLHHVSQIQLLSYPYLCLLQKNKIFVFGGYTQDKKARRSGFILHIQQQQHAISSIYENILPVAQGSINNIGIYNNGSMYYLMHKQLKSKPSGLSQKYLLKFDGREFKLE